MVLSYFLTAARHIRPYPPRGSVSVCSGTPQPSGNLCTTRCARSCATLVLHHPTPGMSAQPETYTFPLPDAPDGVHVLGKKTGQGRRD
eukprot:4550285-Prorocentrum_lima.AAC.1